MDIMQELYNVGIIPVIKIDDANNAVPLARALCEGGLPAAEITFRTAAAAEAIANIARELPDMLVGAGTVLTPEQADTAIAAGAKFVVAPGLNPRVVKHCREKGIPMMPGIANPSDIECALELGLDTLKFFPAEAAGGLPMLKAMCAPYGSVRFMPTGGLSKDNILSYLKFNKIFCCGGSFMVKDDLVKAGEWDKIRDLTRDAVHTMLGFEFYHVGINAENQAEADKSARLLSTFFNIPMGETSKGYMGPGVELMANGGPGTKGHIGIKTNFVDRAMVYLGRLGVKFLPETMVYDKDGKPKFVYLKDELLGFAIHLVQK